ncbi:MAG: 3-isopropylmalate dehydratase small subunit [Halioglobus sp.]|nr:3-isopropylmalate dehydratase small subunit [Halioglobus sp.]
MDKFTRHEGVAAVLLRSNVDTDAIIPSREMKRVSKEGLGEGLFAGWRYLAGAGRQKNPGFVLNQDGYQGASILLSGPNFGCGSSREHAVWALKEFGFRAVIAPGFGAIFASNCVRNGILPLVLAAGQVAKIAAWVAADPARNRVVIDLPAQQVEAAGQVYSFDIEPGARQMLVEGLDSVALTQTRWDLIQAFHERRRLSRPWLY